LLHGERESWGKMGTAENGKNSRESRVRGGDCLFFLATGSERRLPCERVMFRVFFFFRVFCGFS
jgi:hypothetical protein